MPCVIAVQPAGGHDAAAAQVRGAAGAGAHDGGPRHLGADGAAPRGAPAPNPRHRDGDASPAAETPTAGSCRHYSFCLYHGVSCSGFVIRFILAGGHTHT